MEKIDPFKIYKNIFNFKYFKGLLKKTASYTQAANNMEPSTSSSFIIFENTQREYQQHLFEATNLAKDSVIVSFFSGLVRGTGAVSADIFSATFKNSFKFLSSGTKNIFLLIYRGIITFAKGFMAASSRSVNALFNWIFRIDPNSSLAKESFIVKARETFLKIWTYISSHIANIFKYIVNHAKATLLLVGLSIIFIYYSKALSKIYFYIKGKTNKNLPSDEKSQNEYQSEPAKSSEPPKPPGPEGDEQIKIGNIYRDFGIMEISMSLGFNEIKKAILGGYDYLKKMFNFLYNNTDKMVVKVIICGLLLGALSAILSIYSVNQKQS